jgi:hypothetical protein
MANVIAVASKLKAADFIPNYEFQLQDVVVNADEAARQKEYLKMFIEENFSIIENNSAGMPVDQLSTYLKGAKDAIAFVNLWIDSLNVMEVGDGNEG